MFVGLTNVQIKQRPRTDHENNTFNKVNTLHNNIDDASNKKRKSTQERYREETNSFMNMRLISMDDSDVETVDTRLECSKRYSGILWTDPL